MEVSSSDGETESESSSTESESSCDNGTDDGKLYLGFIVIEFNYI